MNNNHITVDASLDVL